MTDKEEFCEQVRRCERSMYALAFSIVRNDADAGEVVSESIYRAYKNLDSLKRDKAFKTWILSIVHNTAVEMIRKDSKTVSVEGLEEATADSGITDRLALRSAVESLKQPYRTVVVLFYYENLSVSKISQITGANASAVKKQLSRARKMLRELLKEDFNV